MITASVAIGDSEQKEIRAYAIELRTPAGVIQVGIDNRGKTYVSSGVGSIILRPSSGNRVIIETED